MKRAAISAFALAAGLLVLGAAAWRAEAQEASGEVTLMSYAGVFQDQYVKAVVEPFMAKHPKIRVKFTTSGNSAQMLGALRAQKSDPQVDVIIFDAGTGLVGNREGLLDTISEQEVPNLANLYPAAIVQKGYGPAVTFDNLVLVYDTTKVTSKPDSLAELWKPEYRGKVGVSGMPNIQGIAFTVMTAKMIGEDWTKSIDRTVKKLAELAPSVQTFDPSPDGYTLVLNGTLEWATGWNARAQFFRNESKGKLGVLLPKEGSVMQINTINLVKGAKNRAAALAFIDYALSAEAQKAFTEAMYYAPANRTAKISEEALGRTATARIDEMLPLDWGWVAKIRDQWNTRWRREVIAAGR
ncbi:MAG TPA: ABC transporter substrate-binding protein [Thermodesulfobacteriota bacterium]